MDADAVPTSPAAVDYGTFVGMVGPELHADEVLELGALRRFMQAVMDPDPTAYDPEYAGRTKFGGVAAPPLYPVHSFRRPSDSADPLAALAQDPELDGTQGSLGVAFGLPPIPTPFRRLLNGGNDIAFYRCLRVGERVVAQATYEEVTLKHGRQAPFLLVVVATTFRTSDGELLLVNRQSLIWR